MAVLATGAILASSVMFGAQAGAKETSFFQFRGGVGDQIWCSADEPSGSLGVFAAGDRFRLQWADTFADYKVPDDLDPTESPTGVRWDFFIGDDEDPVDQYHIEDEPFFFFERLELGFLDPGDPDGVAFPAGEIEGGGLSDLPAPQGLGATAIIEVIIEITLEITDDEVVDISSNKIHFDVEFYLDDEFGDMSCTATLTQNTLVRFFYSENGGSSSTTNPSSTTASTGSTAPPPAPTTTTSTPTSTTAAVPQTTFDDVGVVAAADEAPPATLPVTGSGAGALMFVALAALLGGASAIHLARRPGID